MRRIQGLCLLFLGVLLGWFAGGELAIVARHRAVFSTEGLWVGVKLAIGLALIFVGLIFVVGASVWPRKVPDEVPTSGGEKR